MGFGRVLLITLALTACAPRGTLTLDPQAASVGEVTPIFVGTTRAIDPATGIYGKEKSEVVGFGRFDVSVPPDRKPGEITIPKPRAKPDPATDFLTTDAVRFSDATGFKADLGRAIRSPDNPNREAVIFVHGFNTNFAEGLYRLAQLSHDLKMPGVIVHYSWPSIANPLGYVRDRDSAQFARDGLEDLIRQVEAAGAERVYVVAHSMGSAVAMESLRQIAIRGDRGIMDHVGGVVLISPDLDVDVFRAEAHAMGQLPQPFIIFGSRRDKFLGLSGRLTGEQERLGNLSDISRLADLDVTFLDVTNYSEGAGHFDLGDSPALIRLIGGITEVSTSLTGDQRNRVGLLPGVILTVRNATEVILAPVAIVGEELGG
jgi:esterase/lipase superfamily enzyme